MSEDFRDEWDPMDPYRAEQRRERRRRKAGLAPRTDREILHDSELQKMSFGSTGDKRVFKGY